jgi:hypothetical protein
MNSRPPRTSQSGVALITTVIVVAVLAVVAVAFMQSTSVDRLSSRTVRDYFEAQLAAEAAATIGSGELARLLATYPDSVTAWQNIGGARTNEATVLYVRAQAANTNTNARPGQHGSAIALLARPLVSGGALVPLGAIGTNMPFDGPGPAQVNLNATNATQPVPLVGLRSMTNGGAPVTAANWIYVGRTPGPTNAANPAIARYAYWIEDESFKVNLNIATNGARGAVSLGTGPREIRIDGSFGSSSNIALRSVNLANVMTARRGLPAAAFPSASTAAIPAGLQEQAASDELRFISTVNSAGLDISRGGFKRFNINSVTNGITGPTDANNIRTNLNRLIVAITNSNSVPDFGQRFYRNVAGAIASEANITNRVSVVHGPIYLQKIAANTLDFVDTDDQPTIVNNDALFSLRTGKPDFGIEPVGGGNQGPNPVAAMGVENVPRLQEYALHGRLRELNPIGYNSNSPPPAPAANYRISIDHYFEFWNPGTRDITINGAFLKIYDQPRFGDNMTGPLATEGRPFEVPVNGITFPAGRVTVLTTAPEAELNEALVPAANRANVVHLDTAAANRIFEGQTRDFSSGAAFGGNGFNRYFKVSLKARSTSNTDYESAMVLGNNDGILESFVGLSIVRANATAAVPSVHFVASSAAAAGVVGDTPDIFRLGNQYYAVAGSLRGNSTTTVLPSSTEGDPRALNEQLEFYIYDGGASPDQTRFFSANLDNGAVPALSSLGAPNANFVRSTNWTDYSSTASGNSNAPLIVRNAVLQSIGDLGHVTDPARLPGTNSALATPAFARGGGRTLRIGQPEHPRWYDRSQVNASRAWTSWRLADVFTTTAPSNNVTAADPLGILTNNLGVVRGPTNTNGAVLTIPGLINPNGALRDNGASLRAALHGFQFLQTPDGASGIAGRSISTNGINAVVTNLLVRMTNSPTTVTPAGSLNVLWERGEISELPLFNSGTNLAAPTDMSTIFDRGREEVVRRSIEMLTTRGSVFTVYAIGQTLAPDGRVSGTARLKQVVEFTPVYTNAPAAFTDNFDPNDAQAVATRFAPPVSYSFSVLSSAYE